MKQIKHSFEIGIRVEGTKLTPLEPRSLPKERGGNRAYLFKCDCGTLTVQPISAVRLGRRKSCGCAHREAPQSTRFSETQARAAFWAKVTNLTKSCWGWSASKDQCGYGTMQYHGVVQRAHRISWQIHHGAIPKGMRVLHKCDNPECTKPIHLFLGTQNDNMLDCSAKGRIRTGDRRGEKSGVSPFTASDIVRIRQQAKSGVAHSAIARKLEVCRQSIDAIVSRKTWSHVGD